MSTVLVIGLPNAIRARVEALGRRRSLSLKFILADVGREGTLRLLPAPSMAIHQLREYADSLESYADCFVLVLPYARVPTEVDSELVVLQELDATITRLIPGRDGCPPTPSGKPRPEVLDQVFQALANALPGTDPIVDRPSAYIRLLGEDNPRLLLTAGALSSCNAVAKHRHQFIRNAGDAFVQLINEGAGGRHDAFFSSKGLGHAQTGGIAVTFEFYDNGSLVFKEVCSTHLKQGDKTTPEAAARIYYHHFLYKGLAYIAVLYAGPHPNEPMTRTYHL